MMAATTTLLVLISSLLATHIDTCAAFQIRQPHPFESTIRSRYGITTALWYQPLDEGNGDESDSSNDLDNHPFNRRRQQEESEKMAFERHMATVRSLQLNYYTTSVSHLDNPKQPACTLQEHTGRLLHLPLWRDAQTHLPGRSHVLEISDPIYTNMFESILYKPQPWCFGHLYSQDETDNSTPATVEPHTLSTWQDVGRDDSLFCSPVLGCLMHIADYRRMSDGRLLLLVHAMERFGVTDVLQKLPYSIVNAQVLPDVEEIDPLLLEELHPDLTEADLQEARAMAVQESVRYHAYEYDPHHSFSDDVIISTIVDTNPSRLAGSMNSSNFPLPPLPPQQQIQVQEHQEISKAAIAKVLPFCPFSKTPLEDLSLSVKSNHAGTGSNNDASANADDTLAPNTPSLEYRLLHRGILQVPPTDPDFASHDMTLEELEHQLWLAMNHFLVTTKLPVSPILLSLLPPETEEQVWPKDFLLDKIAVNLDSMERFQHDFVVVSPDYPAYRRQRRLSFSAAYLLEDYYETKHGHGKQGQSLKALLLSIPSTRQRLRVVLERFLQWQQQAWGEFQ
jgi:Lon protease-like protein